jgi:hypothetical protein
MPIKSIKCEKSFIEQESKIKNELTDYFDEKIKFEFDSYQNKLNIEKVDGEQAKVWDVEFRCRLLNLKERALSLKSLRYDLDEILKFSNLVHQTGKSFPRTNRDQRWSLDLDAVEINADFFTKLRAKQVIYPLF